MSKYWFANEEQKKAVVPFKHFSEEKARLYGLEDDNIKFKQEVLDDRRALNNILGLLTTMTLACRSKGTVTLDEEDCIFLYDIASGQVQLDFSKLDEVEDE